jgi:hypothetical protein
MHGEHGATPDETSALANPSMAGEIERGPTLGFPEQQPAFEALEHAINWATSCAICPSWRFTECATPTLVPC